MGNYKRQLLGPVQKTIDNARNAGDSNEEEILTSEHHKMLISSVVLLTHLPEPKGNNGDGISASLKSLNVVTAYDLLQLHPSIAWRLSSEELAKWNVKSYQKKVKDNINQGGWTSPSFFTK